MGYDYGGVVTSFLSMPAKAFSLGYCYS